MEIFSNDSRNISTIVSSCGPDVTRSLHSEWVYKVFQQCIYTDLQYAAFFIGLSSILCWFIAQAPQMITNCRQGKADQALSFWFLLQWFAGDATNLAGALLTKQLATQIVTAVYFVLIDMAMMGQFLYYVVKHQGVKGLLRIFRCPKEEAVLIILPGLMCTLLWTTGNPVLWGNAYATKHGTGRGLLSHPQGSEPIVNVHSAEDLSGYILGCISAVFYVCSRVPQIVKNFARCSVDGLSYPMFVLAVLGNVTYGLGIFLYSVEPVFILRKLPWIVGSVGTLFFDFTVLCQFIAMQCLGCRCGRTIEEDPERQPLLNSAAHNGLPCLDKRGSIQSSSEKKGTETPVPDDEIITSYYTMPKN